MLACERWTLTHSSGWAAVLAALALRAGLALLAGLALALLPGPELEVMSASRVAEAVAGGEVRDDDGEDEPVWDGEPAGELDEPAAELDEDADAAGEVEREPETEPDGEGDDGVLPGLLAGFVPDDAGAVGDPEPEELEEGDGDGEPDGDGECDGDGGPDGDGDFDGVGVGVAVAAAGRASHVVAVLAAVLVEALRLAETASAFIVLAWAAPGQPASTPRVSDPPATRLSTAARTCARRMKTALSPLFEVTGCSLWGS